MYIAHKVVIHFATIESIVASDDLIEMEGVVTEVHQGGNFEVETNEGLKVKLIWLVNFDDIIVLCLGINVAVSPYDFTKADHFPVASMAILLIDCYIDISGEREIFTVSSRQYTYLEGCPRTLSSELSNVDGIVITGSVACIGDGDAWLQTLQNVLIEAITQKIPCFGVCFGHQVLAHVCGADVGKMPLAEVGWKQISILKDSPLLSAIPQQFGCFLSHEDGVLAAGEHLEILASSSECSIQAFQHREYPVLFISSRCQRKNPKNLLVSCSETS